MVAFTTFVLLTGLVLATSVSINLHRRRATSSRAARRLLDSQITLSDYYNNEFVGVLGIGTPPQYLTVVFDTGSSDVWIPEATCSSCGKHDSFKATASSSFYQSTSEYKPFKVVYGSGIVQGEVASDVLTLGDLALPDAQFGLVTYEDTLIQSFDMDGICGLAFSGLSSATSPTVLELIAETYPNMSNSFSLYLSSDPDDKTHMSSLSFGSYNLSIVSEEAEFYYTPVVRMGAELTYWTVSLTSFAITSSSSFTTAAEAVVQFTVCALGSNCLAIVDSGTSGIAIPSEYYDSVLAMVTAGKKCKGLSCAGVKEADFPVLLLYMEPDNIFPLLPADYIVCTAYSECILRFQVSSGFWILGDAFIESYYTHFDIENMRVGFACDGECSGGTWHGRGGYLLASSDESLWKRAAMIYALFVILLMGLLNSLNYVRKTWFSEEDDSLGSQPEQRMGSSKPIGSKVGSYSRTSLPYTPLYRDDSAIYVTTSSALDSPVDGLNRGQDSEEYGLEEDPYSIFSKKCELERDHGNGYS